MLLKLFLTFFKIGACTFGGGYAMIPLIQAEALKNNWLDEQTLVDFIAVSESTPGPFAVNIATFIGRELAGFSGAAAATAGVVLPSFLAILLVVGILDRFRKSKWTQGALSGISFAVVGLISAALLRVGTVVFFPNGLQTDVFTDPAFYAAVGIFLIAVFLAFRKTHPIRILLLCAALGLLMGFMLKLNV